MERCLWILGVLQVRGHINTQRVRDESGIARRTFWRDIDTLRAAGFIIIAVRESGQRYNSAHLKYGGFDPHYAEIARRAAS